MKKVSTIKASLLGSASALGYNWIYDRDYLLERSIKDDLLFKSIDHVAYDEADTSFDVYPDFLLGDVDFMGEVLYLFDNFMSYSEDKSPLNWRITLYNHIQKEGSYKGYIESYGKELLTQVQHEKKYGLEAKLFTDHIDKQLIVPLLLLSLLENDNIDNKVEKALEYTSVLTGYENTLAFNEMLYSLLVNLQSMSKKEALLKSITFAPEVYKESLNKAVTMKNLNEFLYSYAGVACGLDQSFPLIYFLVAHSDNWEDALRSNVILGGASSARGIFISAIFNLIDGIDEKYEHLLNKVL